MKLRCLASAAVLALTAAAAATAAPLLPEPAVRDADFAELCVYQRAPEPKGPMGGFGYDYFTDHIAAQGIAPPALLQRRGLWGAGGEYAYEALNLVDGRRTVRQIRDDLAAIYGPLPVAEVAEYLGALEKIGIVRRE